MANSEDIFVVDVEVVADSVVRGDVVNSVDERFAVEDVVEYVVDVEMEGETVLDLSITTGVTRDTVALFVEEAAIPDIKKWKTISKHKKSRFVWY